MKHVIVWVLLMLGVWSLGHLQTEQECFGAALALNLRAFAVFLSARLPTSLPSLVQLLERKWLVSTIVPIMLHVIHTLQGLKRANLSCPSKAWMRHKCVMWLHLCGIVSHGKNARRRTCWRSKLCRTNLLQADKSNVSSHSPIFSLPWKQPSNHGTCRGRNSWRTNGQTSEELYTDYTMHTSPQVATRLWFLLQI